MAKGASMLSTVSTPTGVQRTRRRILVRFAAAAASTMAALAVLLVGGSSAALATGAYFVAEDTDATWDGAVATVSFREAEVEVEGDVTTISVKVTADVTAVCTRGESTLTIRRSATVLDVADYPIGGDGIVAGTATLPLEVKGLKPAGYSCVTQHLSVTAELEDFWTGATLLHKT
jgi:hypothetical protein